MEFSYLVWLLSRYGSSRQLSNNNNNSELADRTRFLRMALSGLKEENIYMRHCGSSSVAITVKDDAIFTDFSPQSCSTFNAAECLLFHRIISINIGLVIWPHNGNWLCSLFLANVQKRWRTLLCPLTKRHWCNNLPSGAEKEPSIKRGTAMKTLCWVNVKNPLAVKCSI